VHHERVVVEEEARKKVLILMSDTGGGHRASAQALAGALERADSKIECEILDIWTECAPWPYRNFVPYYQYLAKRPLLWRACWAYARFPVTRGIQEIAARISCYDHFEKAIADREPDLIVSVHPLTQSIPLRVKDKMDERKGTKTPFVTVVTDLASAHPTWFHKKVDKCFVPSENVKKLAKKVGLTEEKLIQHGLPLREAFCKPETRSKDQLREELGLPKLTTALVVGGGDGVGRISKVATSIADEIDEEVSLVVVCGKNDVVKDELRHHKWPKHVRATILGFVRNMDEYMAAADCIVTKAGPGTIAEASTRGLPTLLSSYLPGQEAGNVRYVTRDKKFGDFRRRPKRIARTVKNWLADEQKRTELSHHASLAATLDATANIANDIAAFFKQQDNNAALVLEKDDDKTTEEDPASSSSSS